MKFKTVKKIIYTLGLNLSFLLATLFFYNEALADYKGFVRIRSDREIYVEYVKAQKNNPTVVLLNGLTYSTCQWDSMALYLASKGIGVLRFDFYGQGRTLLKYAPILAEIPYEEQVQDLRLLLNKMQIQAPFNLVGFSYGGGIASAFASQFPAEIENLILLAPFTEAIKTMDTWIKAQIWATRQVFPYNKYTDEDLYSYFLRQIVYATYPQAEPVVLENPFKLEATFRLAEGIRKYIPAQELSVVPPKSVHLLVSVQDQYLPEEVLAQFWGQLPDAIKASRLYVHGTEHKMPEEVPQFLSSWILEILQKNPLLFKGLDFEGFPNKGIVRSKDGRESIQVDKD